MSEFEYGLIEDFVGENWAMFVAFMEERGVGEGDCERLVATLEILAGRH